MSINIFKSMQSDHTLYCSRFYLDIPKNDNGEFQNVEGGLFHLRNATG